MKYFLLIYGLFAACAASAQTNLSSPSNASPTVVTNSPGTETPAAAAPTNSILRAATEIASDSANFDLKSRIAVYIGNVHVKDPQMEMTCAIMTARVPASGRIDSIIAEQNVVIDASDDQGRPIHATGDKAVYTYKVADGSTNETIALSGTNTTFRSAMFNGTGDPIVWDRLNGNIRGSNLHMFIEPLPSRVRTNAPSAVKPEGK
jgi:lipopolysaccharide export system protein LptA